MLISLVSLFSTANAGCDPTTVTDDFAGEQRIRVAGQWIAFEKAKSITLAFPFVVDHLTKATIPAGSKAQFKLEDGTMLELPVQHAVPPEISAMGHTRWPAIFELQPNDLSALADSRLKAVRYPLSDGRHPVLDAVTESGFKLIQKQLLKTAGCATTSFR